MNDSQSLRMLLSHNFDLNDGKTPALSREDFTQVFIDGFSSHPEIKCRQVDNPHWIVEVVCVAGFLASKLPPPLATLPMHCSPINGA
jgi:hypothetical protein